MIMSKRDRDRKGIKRGMALSIPIPLNFPSLSPSVYSFYPYPFWKHDSIQHSQIYPLFQGKGREGNDPPFPSLPFIGEREGMGMRSKGNEGKGERTRKKGKGRGNSQQQGNVPFYKPELAVECKKMIIDIIYSFSVIVMTSGGCPKKKYLSLHFR